MQYIWAFVIGGLICMIGQILIDKTKLTPARILVSFVVAGVILKAFGIYDYLIRIGGAGATVPISGFGSTLCRGVERAVAERGWIGIFTGGLTAAAAGICAAIVFGFFVSVVFHSRSKK